MPKYYQVLLETPYSVLVEKFCINDRSSNYLAARQAFELLTKKAENDYFKCKNNYPDYEAFFEDCNYELEKISKKEFYNKGENETMNKDLTTLILEKLAAGQTAEDIASEVSDAINKAETEATIKSEKTADTKKLLIEVAAYLTKYYPKIEIDGICTDPTDKDVEEVMKLIDDIANFDKVSVFSFPFGRLFH